MNIESDIKNLKIEVVKINNIISDSLVKKTDIEDLNKLTNVVANIKNDIYSIKKNMSDYDTKNELLYDKISSTDYIKKNDVYTKDEIDSKGYITEQITLDDYYTKNECNSKYLLANKFNPNLFVKQTNFETILKEYVKKSELPNLDKYALKKDLINYNGIKNILSDYIKNKNYITKDYIYSFFYTKDKIDDIFLNKENAFDKLLSKSEAIDKYLTISDSYKIFLTKEDYRGIKSASTLNSYYNKKSNEFFLMLNKKSLLDGLYLVNDTLYVVKNNKEYGITGGENIKCNLKWEITDTY